MAALKAGVSQDEEMSLSKHDVIDTVHNDEAMKVLAMNTGSDTWEASEEKKLIRKIDRKLLSLLCLTYGLQV